MILGVLRWRRLGSLFSEHFESAALRGEKKREKTLERRTTSVTRAPPTATEGAGLMFCMRSCGWVPRCEQSALKGCSADTFLCSPVTLDWTERRGSRGSAACGGRSQQLPAPMYLYYIVLTKFMCLTTPLLLEHRRIPVGVCI